MRLNLQKNSRQLLMLIVSWSLFLGTVLISNHNLKSDIINLVGSEKMILELELELAEENYHKLIHSFDKATHSSSAYSFLEALQHFHALNTKLYLLSVAKSDLLTNELKQRSRLLAQNTVTHFLEPFNKNIKKMDASVAKGSQRPLIKQFVADYDDFQLLHQGPFDLGQISPLQTDIIGL